MSEIRLINMRDRLYQITITYDARHMANGLVDLYLAYQSKLLTKTEYDCLCDLLLIPVRVRYDDKCDTKKLRQYAKNMCQSERCSMLFKDCLLLARKFLEEMYYGLEHYTTGAITNAIGIMREVVYNRIKYNMGRNAAITRIFANAAMVGVIAPIQFFCDLCRDNVGITINDRYVYSPYAFMQMISSAKAARSTVFNVCDKKDSTVIYSIKGEIDTYIRGITNKFYISWETYFESCANDATWQAVQQSTQQAARKGISMRDMSDGEKELILNKLRNHYLTKQDIECGIVNFSLVYFTILLVTSSNGRAQYTPISYTSIYALENTLLIGCKNNGAAFDTSISTLKIFVKDFKDEQYTEIFNCKLSVDYIAELRNKAVKKVVKNEQTSDEAVENVMSMLESVFVSDNRGTADKNEGAGAMVRELEHQWINEDMVKKGYGVRNYTLLYYTVRDFGQKADWYTHISKLDDYLTTIGSVAEFDKAVDQLKFYVKMDKQGNFAEICGSALELGYKQRLRDKVAEKEQRIRKDEIAKMPICDFKYFMHRSNGIFTVIYDVPDDKAYNESKTRQLIEREGLPIGSEIKYIRVYHSGNLLSSDMRPDSKLTEFLSCMTLDNVKGNLWRNLYGHKLSRNEVDHDAKILGYVVFTVNQGAFCGISELYQHLFMNAETFEDKMATLTFYVRFGNNLFVEIPHCELSDEFKAELRELMNSKTNAFKKRKVKPQKVRKNQRELQAEEQDYVPEYINGVEMPPPPIGFTIMPDDPDENILTKPLSEFFRDIFK